MSKVERLGGCAWKLFQVGLVAVLLAAALLLILHDGKEGDRNLAKDGAETVDGQTGGGASELVAKIKRMFSGEERTENGKRGRRSSASMNVGENSLKAAQEKKGEGTIDLAELLEHSDDLYKDTAMLAEGTTQVHQTVLWQVIDGVIYYRIILNPYDRAAHKMMMQPSEALFISFIDEGGVRRAPTAAAMRIEMRKLRVATKEGYAVGWFVDGKISLEEQEEEAVQKAQVGWIFSGRLHARLRQLQKPGQMSADGVSAPIGVGTKTE